MILKMTTLRTSILYSSKSILIFNSNRPGPNSRIGRGKEEGGGQGQGGGRKRAGGGERCCRGYEHHRSAVGRVEEARGGPQPLCGPAVTGHVLFFGYWAAVSTLRLREDFVGRGIRGSQPGSGRVLCDMAGSCGQSVITHGHNMLSLLRSIIRKLLARAFIFIVPKSVFFDIDPIYI